MLVVSPTVVVYQQRTSMSCMKHVRRQCKQEEWNWGYLFVYLFYSATSKKTCDVCKSTHLTWHAAIIFCLLYICMLFHLLEVYGASYQEKDVQTWIPTRASVNRSFSWFLPGSQCLYTRQTDFLSLFNENGSYLDAYSKRPSNGHRKKVWSYRFEVHHNLSFSCGNPQMIW